MWSAAAWLSRVPALCYLVPSVVVVGAVPQFYAMWFLWRLLSLLLPPWVYQRGDDLLFSAYQRLILFFFEHCSGVRIELHGEAAEAVRRAPERVLYLANHQSTLDWVVVDMLAVRQGSLGRLRYVMKDGLQFLPVYGFYFYQHGCIYVRRGKFNPDKMMKGLDYLENPKISSWLIIFPEGTRFNPEAKDVIEKSRDYAKDQGLSELQHLLTPRSTGLYLSLDKLRQHFDAVYDVTVLYGNTKDKVTGQRLKAPQMGDFLTGRCNKIHIHLNRIPISSVPTTQEGLKKWLHKLYVHKDKLISKFYEPHGADDNPVVCLGKGTDSRLSLWHTLPCLLLVFTVHAPLLTFQIGRTLYWKLWLFSTLGGYVWLAIRSVA